MLNTGDLGSFRAKSGPMTRSIPADSLDGTTSLLLPIKNGTQVLKSVLRRPGFMNDRFDQIVIGCNPNQCYLLNREFCKGKSRDRGL